MLLSKIFRLEIIGRVLESIVNIVIFSLVVIFQPELRRLLGYLGQPDIFKKSIFNLDRKKEVKSLVNQITESVKHLSKSHTGALIVIQDMDGAENYLEVGTRLDAKVSTELLLTIFHPNTPLHDGAVVIIGDRIIAASVLLPLTEDPNLSWRYGTRHRAAIGMSEVSNAACIVVSEETGDISIAHEGKLTKYPNVDALKAELDYLYKQPDKNSDVNSKFMEQSEKKFKLNHSAFRRIFQISQFSPSRRENQIILNITLWRQTFDLPPKIFLKLLKSIFYKFVCINMSAYKQLSFLDFH